MSKMIEYVNHVKDKLEENHMYSRIEVEIMKIMSYIVFFSFLAIISFMFKLQYDHKDFILIASVFFIYYIMLKFTFHKGENGE